MATNPVESVVYQFMESLDLADNRIDNEHISRDMEDRLMLLRKRITSACLEALGVSHPGTSDRTHAPTLEEARAIVDANEYFGLERDAV